MDNLTHSLTGLFLARAGLRRLAPDATLILVLAANAPDIDVVSSLGGAAVLLRWHRDFTHSFAFSLVLAIVVVLAVRLFSRQSRFWFQAILVSWIGVLSHILIDLTNNYGVRALLPFSSRWLHWDIFYVIDPYVWGVFLLALAAPFLSGLLSSEIGQSGKKREPSRTVAVLALAFFLLFGVARTVLHAREVATLDSRLYSGQVPQRVAAFPTMFNPLDWNGLVETADRYFLFDLSVNTEFDPASGRVFFIGDPGDAAADLRKSFIFRSLMEFDQYPLWRVIDDENNSRYTLTDLRFGDPVAQTFTCSARLVRKAVVDERCDFTFSAPGRYNNGMKIRDLLSRGTPCFSFEFFPPKSEEAAAQLEKTISELKPLAPTFVSVTYGAGGSTREKTLAIVSRIKTEAGIESMAHLTCVGSTRQELEGVLDRLVDAGIQNVLALRGDPPKGQTEFVAVEGGFRYATDLVTMVRERYGSRLSVGGAAYPERHTECPNPHVDLMNLKRKVDAGLDFLVTQLFFDNRRYFEFVDRARRVGIQVPIIPGIMPITNAAQIERFTSSCGATLPFQLAAELDRRRNDADAVLQLGVSHATHQCADLLMAGAPGIHFYTLNRSTATKDIFRALEATGFARNAEPQAEAVLA